jgi:hypothetical protein
MFEAKDTTRADRLHTAAEAKKAQLAKFKPKPAVQDPHFAERGAKRAAEVEAVRQARSAAKEAARQAKADAEEAARRTVIEAEEAELAAKRGERKERKMLTKAEAKAKRDVRYASRQARRA